MCNNLIGNSLTDACESSPASSQHAITAGGTTEDDRLYVSLFSGSNFGKCVTLYAPAQYVAAASDNNSYR